MLKTNEKVMPPLTKAVVCLQKGLIVIPQSEDVEDNIAYASTVQSKLLDFGYILGGKAFKKLCGSSVSFIIRYHDEVMEYLRSATGGKMNYVPLYGDFPTTMMTEKDAYIMENALHYFIGKGSFEGFTPVMDKPVDFEKTDITILELANEEHFNNIFTSLVGVNVSLLPQDLEVIKWFVSSGYELVFPANGVPFKENLCTLAAMKVPGLPIKTTVDVLRIAVHMSGGDISLPAVPPAMKTPKFTRGKVPNPEREKFKFKKFSRAERRYLLELLENTHCDPKEMVLKDQRWIRLGEILHPGEYKSRFPKTFRAFMAIRSTKVTSWYGELNAAFKVSLARGLDVLGMRAGEMVRRMDWLVRTYTGSDNLSLILYKFTTVVSNASNKVLYELYTHFEKRKDPTVDRKVMIKGKRKATNLPDLPALPTGLIVSVQHGIKDVLIAKFSKLDPLGKCWIDPELFKISLPINMRSINFSLKPVIRGQRTPIFNKDSKVVRAFFHWFDEHARLDPDLSATFVGDDKHKVLSYSGLKVGNSCHSGDVIARRGACAEYIDIDIADAKQAGYKYVLVDVRNYRGGSLAEMQGMFGLMEREYPESNKTWIPATVSNCHATSSEASNTLLTIIDLITMEYIFLDVDSTGSTFARGDVKTILETVKQYSQPPKFSVGHLLQMHAEARGTDITNDVPEVPGVTIKLTADTVFNFDDFCHSYELIGKYMGI